MAVSNIRTYIERSGIKQGYVADKAGIKRDAFCMTMQGKRKLTLDEYCKICAALNVPVDMFINHQKAQAPNDRRENP